MTDREALTVLGTLAGLTNGWHDDVVESWVAQLMRLGDPAVAMASAQTLADHHTGPGHPSWGEFRRVYLAELGRRQTERPALPGPSEACTLADYLEGLRARQAAGDPDAAALLEPWHNLAERQARHEPDHPPAWLDALKP